MLQLDVYVVQFIQNLVLATWVLGSILGSNTIEHDLLAVYYKTTLFPGQALHLGITLHAMQVSKTDETFFLTPEPLNFSLLISPLDLCRR